MADKVERLLDEILNKIEQEYKFNLRGHWTRNSHWKDALMKINDFDSFSETIIKKVGQCVEGREKNDLHKYQNKIKDKDYKKRRTHITLTTNGKRIFH